LPAEFKGFGQRNFIKRKKDINTPSGKKTVVKEKTVVKRRSWCSGISGKFFCASGLMASWQTHSDLENSSLD
jgi:hypothetical protein